jgi:hypothetical protein
MALETRVGDAVSPGRGVSPWVTVLAVLATAAASACVGAWWARGSLRAELTLRPPVVLFDMAGAVHGSEGSELAAAVARAKGQARRLAEGGVLVLDAQAVIAAPPELYLDSTAALDEAGGVPR